MTVEQEDDRDPIPLLNRGIFFDGSDDLMILAPYENSESPFLFNT